MTTATEALEAWNRLDSEDGLGPALHVGQMLADALTSLSRASALSTPPADDVREAVIRELHPDYPSPIPALNQLYEDHADRFLDRFEVCPRGTVTDAARMEYTIAAEVENGAVIQLADYTTVVRDHLKADLFLFRQEEEQRNGAPDRIFIAERPIPKWVRS